MSAGRRSMLFMVLFVATWAAVEALATRLHQAYSPYQIVFTRYVAHVALMVALWGWRAPATLCRTRRPVFQLARSLLMLLMPASWILATQHGVAPTTVLTVFWTCPVLIVAIAAVGLGERPSAPLWSAAGVASAGAIAALGRGPLPVVRLLVFPAAMAGSFSLYVSMTRSLRTETTRANLFYTAAGVALALAAAMPRVWITPSPHDLAVMVGIGVVGFVGLWALDRMAATAPVARSAPLVALQVAFLVLIEWGLRRGVPNARTAASLSLIALAALYTWVREPALVPERAL